MQKYWLLAMELLAVTLTVHLPCVESESRPRGLFIQVSSATGPWVLPYLSGWLQNICYRNAQLPAADRMNDIVLQDIATENATAPGGYTMRYEVLDMVMPYLPGGAWACFGNVFVGSIEVAWKGSGNLYDQGIQDSAFRKRNVDLSRTVVTQFRARYPQLRAVHHWYITYESNLNYLTDPGILAGYQSYLTDLILMFSNIAPSRAVMWSPAFWLTPAQMSPGENVTLAANLKTLFTNVRTAAPPGVTWMNMQDSVGKGSNAACTGVKTTPADAVQLYRFLTTTFQFASMQMNEELFDYDGNCNLVETPAAKQIQREGYYSSQGVRMGATFEIRYWRERWATTTASTTTTTTTFAPGR